MDTLRTYSTVHMMPIQKKETHVNVNSLVILGVHGSLLDSYQDLKFRFGIQIQHLSLT